MEAFSFPHVVNRGHLEDLIRIREMANNAARNASETGFRSWIDACIAMHDENRQDFDRRLAVGGFLLGTQVADAICRGAMSGVPDPVSFQKWVDERSARCRDKGFKVVVKSTPSTLGRHNMKLQLEAFEPPAQSGGTEG